MPLPLIAIVQALVAGGSLVPHAAGGMIVTSASGYVAGTYLSTTAIATLVGSGATLLGAGAATVTGAASTIIGSAGIFGTTIGASGITGALMSAGIISSTPIWIPAAIGGALVGISSGGIVYYRLRRKATSTPEGHEAHFTEFEAKIVERIIRAFRKRKKGEGEA
jgi:hypothetical protein